MRGASRQVTEAEREEALVSSSKMKRHGRKKKDLLFCTQQRVIELADLFHPALPFLIVGQPAFHHLPLLRPDAELPVTASRISHRQNQNLVPLSGFAARTTLAVKDRAF